MYVFEFLREELIAVLATVCTGKGAALAAARPER